MKKTLLVGLDAACWDYLDPMLRTGDLPFLQQLMESGAWGTMLTTMPPWTPAAWASIVTGKNPGKHGVFDMLQRQPGTHEFHPVSATTRKGTPFWRRLNEYGIRVGLVNVPFTFPPDALDGFVVCGFGTPNTAKNITYPLGLLDKRMENYGHYRPTVSSEILRSGTPEEILEFEGKHQELQIQIAVDCVRDFEVDVLVINLMLPDHANHRIANFKQVQEAYFQSDIHLKLLFEGFEPDNILLFSDHGSSRVNGYFLLGAWLHDQGYSQLVENLDAERRAALNWILVQWLQAHHKWSGFGEKVVRNLFLESLQKSPQWLQRKFLRGLERIIPFAWDHVHYSDRIDYTKSQVFPGSIYSGLIYLNLTGHNLDGINPIQDRESLLSEISEKLFEIEAPGTVKPLFSNIYTSDQIYSGSLLDQAPDLILDAYDSGWNVQTAKYNPVSEKKESGYFVKARNDKRDSGWHSKEGIFVFAGADFILGPVPIKGHVMDIPATLLHLYEVPVPEDYDGRVLSELFDSALRNKPVQYQPGDPISAVNEGERVSYSSGEEEVLVDHLRALGYLE
ncbi:MAG: alkaline phosphatase family protein [Anaerolineales bacterium]